MNEAPSLEVRRRPRATLAASVVAVAAVLGLVFWFVNSPTALATSDDTVAGSTPAGEGVYLGVARGEAGRTLHLAGVQVHVVADVAAEVTPLLCLGGSVRVTTDPEAFCAHLVEPDGEVLGSDDSIVLRVVAPSPGTVSVDRVRLGFREGVRWGTREAGAPAEVTVLDR